jgi:hypothetical protein
VLTFGLGDVFCVPTTIYKHFHTKIGCKGIMDYSLLGQKKGIYGNMWKMKKTIVLILDSEWHSSNYHVPEKTNS